jgi:membrane protein required for colicin V production
MSALDWVFVTVLLVSLLLGAWRGLVYELLLTVGWVMAFVLAQWGAFDVANQLPMAGASDMIRHAAAFVLIFIAVVFVSSLLAWLVKKMVESVGLRPADRGLGAVFGLLRGVILLLAVTVAVGLTPLNSSAWWQESIGAKSATTLLQALKPVLPQEFGKYLP